MLKGLNLPTEIAESLAGLGNLGVTKSTWSTYRTAKTMLAKCEKDTHSDLSIPLDQKKTLIFIDWMVRCRNLKGSTINSYLAGIRQLHLIQGLEAPDRSGLVKLVLKGISNKDGIQKRSTQKTGRLPMTISMMLVLKKLINSSKRNIQDKRLLWAVSTIAFAGAFRIGELLSKCESTFDPNFTLLTKDVTWSTDSSNKTILHICLKCPKEAKTAAPTIVDVYQNDGPLCPIKAFMTWHKLKKPEQDMPIFREKRGTPLTGAKMNRIIKQLLDPYTNKDKGFFGTHSFRIRLASMLGNNGFTDEEIMVAGRWSSRAFEAYMKLKRRKRALMGRQISNLGQ